MPTHSGEPSAEAPIQQPPAATNTAPAATPPKPEVEINLLQVIQAYEAGFSQEGMARRWGIKPARITKILGKGGLKQADVLKALREGATAQQIFDGAKPADELQKEFNQKTVMFLEHFHILTQGKAPAPLDGLYADLVILRDRIGMEKPEQIPEFLQRQGKKAAA